MNIANLETKLVSTVDGGSFVLLLYILKPLDTLYAGCISTVSEHMYAYAVKVLLVKMSIFNDNIERRIS